MKLFFILFSFLMSLNNYAVENLDDDTEEILPVGKVKYLRGEAFRNDLKLNLGSEVFQGDKVRTEKSSVVKISMVNDSIITVAPQSEMLIEQFISDDENLIHLLKGVMRAKVKKNPTNKENSLIVKSETAALGVRGTDFQFTFNNKNKVSSVLTFEGVVGFKRISSSRFNYSDLDNELSKSNTYEVTRGQFSANNLKTGQINIPTKISATQYHALKRNQDFRKARNKIKKVKIYRSIVPAGAPGKSFESKPKIRIRRNKLKSNKSSEGFYSENDKQFAPAAGGYLDSKTGIYIEPDSKSTYNEDQKIYTPSPDVGRVDPETGEYIPPQNYELTPEGSFKPIKPTSEMRRKRRPPPTLNFLPKNFSREDRLISDNDQAIRENYNTYASDVLNNGSNVLTTIQNEIIQQENQNINNQSNTTQIIINIREQ